MASAEEVQSLKREVEMLKLMLEQERTRGGGGSGELSARALGSSRLPSPTRAHQQQQEGFFHDSKPYEDEFRREPTPRRPVTAATSPSRGKTLRWKDSTSTHQQPPHLHGQAVQSAPYTQFVPTDTKRGKWWLKDRQILSRNVPAPNDHSVAMKVRETWQWSGRTVVVDKIVTGPRPRDDEYDDHYNDRDTRDHRVRDLQDEAARYREELRRIGSARSLPTSQTAPLSSTTVAAQVAFHDSKQLAKEFIQPRADSSAAVEEIAGSMRTASQRMEAQMAQSLAGMSEPQPALDTHTSSGGLTARGSAEPSSPLLPQLSPSKSIAESNLPALQ